MSINAGAYVAGKMSALTRQIVDGWKLKSVAIPSRAELSNLSDYHGRAGLPSKPSGSFEVGKPLGWTGDADGHAPSAAADGGPFETTPDLAQVRIVHSIGLMTKSRNTVELKWSGIVDNIKSEEVRAKISNFNPMQSLPACVKITAATIKSGKGADMRNAFHLQVQDAKRKPLHTPHMYVGGAGRRGASETVGYPLHLLTEEGGYVLEEPPQLTDTFRHYWYISNTMLTCCAYKQESSRGNFVQIPKNSDAARLMYYILVTKNGAGAASSDENITKLSNFEDFQDQNERTCWRFPEFIFNKVRGRPPRTPLPLAHCAHSDLQRTVLTRYHAPGRRSTPSSARSSRTCATRASTCPSSASPSSRSPSSRPWPTRTCPPSSPSRLTSTCPLAATPPWRRLPSCAEPPATARTPATSSRGSTSPFNPLLLNKDITCKSSACCTAR